MEKQIIPQKIIQDAHDKAQSILQKAQNDADLLRAQASLNAQKQLREVQDSCKQDAEIFIERKRTLARLDAKKIVLDCKQALIARAFDLAKNKLANLSKQDYLGYIQKQVQEYAENGDTLLLCASAPVSEAEVLELPAVKGFAMQVKRGDDFGGGIKLLGAKCDKDLSFNAVVADFAKNNVQEISARIFK